MAAPTTVSTTIRTSTTARAEPPSLHSATVTPDFHRGWHGPSAEPPPMLVMLARSGCVTRPVVVSYVSRSTCTRSFALNPVALATHNDLAPTAALLDSVLCTTEKSCRLGGFVTSARTVATTSPEECADVSAGVIVSVLPETELTVTGASLPTATMSPAAKTLPNTTDTDVAPEDAAAERIVPFRVTRVPASVKIAPSGWTTSPDECADASAGVMVSVLPDTLLTVNGPSFPTPMKSPVANVLPDATVTVVAPDDAEAESVDWARRTSSPCLWATASPAEMVTVVPLIELTVACSKEVTLTSTTGRAAASAEASSTLNVVAPAATSAVSTVALTRPRLFPPLPITKSRDWRISAMIRPAATRGCCCTSIWPCILAHCRTRVVISA